MQNYQEVCKTESMVWFEIESEQDKEFLAWAKALGCVWINGKEIDPEEEAGSFHFSIEKDGKLAKVAMFAWVSKQFKDVPRYMFSEYKNGNLISPQEYWRTRKK